METNEDSLQQKVTEATITENTISENSTQVREVINVVNDWKVYFHEGATVVEGQLIADLFTKTDSVRIVAITDEGLAEMGGDLEQLTTIIANATTVEQPTVIAFTQNGNEVSQMAVSSFDSVIESEIQSIIDGGGEIRDPAQFILSRSETMNKVINVRLESIANAEQAIKDAEASVQSQERQESFMRFAKGAGVVGGGALGLLVIVVGTVHLAKKIDQYNSPEAKKRRQEKALTKIQDSHNMAVGEELALNIVSHEKLKMSYPHLTGYALDEDLKNIIQKYNFMRESMKKKGASEADLNKISISFHSLFTKLSVITGYKYYISAIHQWNMSSKKEESKDGAEKLAAAKRAIEIVSDHIDKTMKKFDKSEELDFNVAMSSIEEIANNTSLDQVLKNQTGLDSVGTLNPSDFDEEEISVINKLRSLSEEEIHEILANVKNKSENNTVNK